MTEAVKRSTRIELGEEFFRDTSSIPAAITEPFTAGRATARLLFDFAVMAALMKTSVLSQPVLDFGAGTGWVSEFCARMGLATVAFDIHGDLRTCLEGRAQADNRINPRLFGFSHGDGHAMPFDPEVFGHVLCYDTLHHMHDYDQVFSEFYRVLRSGGRGIFVEPGARHSKSPETVAFLKAQKVHDPSWIERDVVLEEIDQIARSAGFSAGLRIAPIAHPLALQVYSLEAWTNFRNGDARERLLLTDQLSSLNYWDRIIFYVDKPEDGRLPNPS